GMREPEQLPGATALERLKAWLGRAVVAPFVDLFQRTGGGGFVVIVLFIVLYKFGEAMAGTMSNPLYVSLGFAKVEVANIGKIYGFAATLAGLALGGVVVYRLGVFRALLYCGILQASSNLMYVVQAWAGHDVVLLAVTIGKSRIVGGFAVVGCCLPPVRVLTRSASQYSRALIVITPRPRRSALPDSASISALEKAPFCHSSRSCANSRPVEAANTTK